MVVILDRVTVLTKSVSNSGDVLRQLQRSGGGALQRRVGTK
jgi:hypothetical protein